MVAEKDDEKKKGKDVYSEEVLDEESENDDTNNEDLGKGKRKRRVSKVYEPKDFTMEQYHSSIKSTVVNPGRGSKLIQISSVKSSIDKYKVNSDEFIMAYKLLFSRCASNRKFMKQKLLEFSGYLPPLPNGKYDVELQEKADEKIETKYATKAFKMNVAQIKVLCFFFSVPILDDDGKTLIKEDLIDRLLDFLGSPAKILVDRKAARKKQKKATSAAAVNLGSKNNENLFSLIKNYKKGKYPSDAAMRQWVRAYIVCVDLETATTKDAISIASAKFGVEMKEKKNRIKQLLAEEI